MAGAPAEIKGDEITVDIYPVYLLIPRSQEKKLLQTLGARQVLETIP